MSMQRTYVGHETPCVHYARSRANASTLEATSIRDSVRRLKCQIEKGSPNTPMPSIVLAVNVEIARFVRRPNRFLIIARLLDKNGSEVSQDVLVHCPNPGRMLEYFGFGRTPRLIVEPITTPGAKTSHRAVAVEHEGEWVMMKTTGANELTGQVLKEQWLAQLEQFKDVKPEVTVGNSRLDFMLHDQRGQSCYVEVKSVSLVHEEIGYFPDAPSKRASKHVRELKELVEKGHIAAVIFVVQRKSARFVTSNNVLDPQFGKELRSAIKAGVLALAFTTRLKVVEVDDRLQLLYSSVKPIPVRVDSELGFDIRESGG